MQFPPKRDWRGTLSVGLSAESARILLTGWEGALTSAAAGPQPTPLPAEAVALLEPLVTEAMSSVRARLQRLSIRSVGTMLLEHLTPGLQRRLASVYAVPAALGRVRLPSPERLGADRLARVLMEDWVAGIELFLVRLEIDRCRLARWMGFSVLPRIVSISSAASDVHGRAGGVIDIAFSGGRILYKPRPVTGELLWAELNSTLAEVDPDAAVIAAPVLCGANDGLSGYGWMGALTRGEGDEGDHWRRAGSLLCLAQHACMTDLHMANVIATAHGPAVLDAECLGDASARAGGEGDQLEELRATGLLPRDRPDAGDLMPDTSGLFGGAADVGDVFTPSWNQTLKGALEVSFARARLLEQGNRYAMSRPPLACLPEMQEGYLRSARALLSIRADLLRRGGWMDRLNLEHSARVVLRDTLAYGHLMSRSLLPEVAGSVEARREMLRRALSGEPCSMGAELERPVVDAEVEAMLGLCVPRFHLSRGTRDLAGEDGRVLAREIVRQTSAEAIRGRLEAMRLDDLRSDSPAALAAILFRSRSC